MLSTKSNDATRASAEALPAKITRRLFLRDTAIAGAVGASVMVPAAAAVPVAATMTDNAPAEHPWKNENTALIEAWEQYREAETEWKEAKEAREWLADEWKHLWPLAPEELLGAANAHKHYRSEHMGQERDIVGRFLMRDTSALTKRLSAEFRAENERQCFFVDTSAEILERMARLKQLEPKGRTAKALARNRAQKAKALMRLRQKLHPARQYEAETARLRESAGVEAAEQRVKTAHEQLEALAHRVSMERPNTLYGVRLQADVVLFTLERFHISERSSGPFGEAMRLVCNVLDATANLDRGHYKDGEAQS